MQKHQIPNLKHQKKSKFQNSKDALEFDAWNLMLEIFVMLIFFFTIPSLASAQDLTYQHNEQIFIVQPQTTWKNITEVPVFRGKELTVPTGWERPDGITMEQKITWNQEAIATSLESIIGSKINRETGSVHINRDNEGGIIFEGIGLTGRKLLSDLAAELTVYALEEGIQLIQLPIDETNPEIVIDDPELLSIGIHELISIGESDFSRSPVNRRHNIAIGLSQFNGTLINPDAEFSFNEQLGPVNSRTGYRPELTIMGERTVPEYGGGLCQVSTTAFRGAWLSGLPITVRRNHSYAVSYYAPEGTDATIFPPWTDLKFVNDTENSILLQTHVEDNKAYFLFYGTKPNRTTELVGPFTWDITQPPNDRIEYTTDLNPGEIRIVSHRVPGMKTTWYRYITNDGSEPEPEEFFSWYEARPYYEEIGIDVIKDPIFTAPKREEEIIELNENTKLILPRRGERVRMRR